MYLFAPVESSKEGKKAEAALDIHRTLPPN